MGLGKNEFKNLLGVGLVVTALGGGVRAANAQENVDAIDPKNPASVSVGMSPFLEKGSCDNHILMTFGDFDAEDAEVVVRIPALDMVKSPDQIEITPEMSYSEIMGRSAGDDSELPAGQSRASFGPYNLRINGVPDSVVLSLCVKAEPARVDGGYVGAGVFSEGQELGSDSQTFQLVDQVTTLRFPLIYGGKTTFGKPGELHKPRPIHVDKEQDKVLFLPTISRQFSNQSWSRQEALPGNDQRMTVQSSVNGRLGSQYR